MNKKLAVIGLVGLAGYLNLFWFRSWGMVTVGWLLAGGLGWLAWSGNAKARVKLSWIWGLGMVLLAGLVWRGGVTNQLLAVGGLAGLGVVAVYLIMVEEPVFRSVAEVMVMPIRLALGYMEGGLKVLDGIFQFKVGSKFKGRQVNWRTWLVGGLFGLVGVTLIGGLLASGDAVFGQMLNRWFNFQIKFPAETVGRVMLSLVVVGIGLPIVWGRIKKEFISPTRIWQGVVGEKEALIGVVMVAALIGVFLVIQWPYIFASVPAETHLRELGVLTYSEYVRRGFVELVLVTLIGYTIAGLGYVSWAGQGRKFPLLQWSLIALITELGLFSLSVLRRVWLYQSYHGWSLIRIYGSWLVVWVVVMLGMLVWRHFRRGSWIRLEMGVTAAFLVVAVWFNVEHFIVTTHPPTVNNRVDYVYLSKLSSDGYEGWNRAMDYATGVVNDERMQKVLLNGEDRREIFYAGLITIRLGGRLSQLAQSYGTEPERLSLTTELLESFRKQSEDYLAYYLPQSNQAAAEHSKNLATQIEKIKNMQKRAGDKNLATEVEMDGWWGMDVFESNYLPSFAYLCENEGCKRSNKLIDRWDQAVRFNGQENLAYEKLYWRKGELFNLQERLTKLLIRIRRQPVGERRVDVDISTLTPLLFD